MKSEPDDLKNALRANRPSMSENHGTRLHRAISWLKCASEQADNPDLQFISLWVSFNACYSSDRDGASELTQREEFMQFVRRLARHDAEKSIPDLPSIDLALVSCAAMHQLVAQHIKSAQYNT